MSEKKFWPENDCGAEKILGLKKMLTKKFYGSEKKILSEKNLKRNLAGCLSLDWT